MVSWSREEFAIHQLRREAQRAHDRAVTDLIEGRDNPIDASPERVLHDRVIKECRQRGYYVVHSRTDRRTTTDLGTPDVILAAPDGLTVWIELKSSKAKLRPEQSYALAHLKKLNHRAVVIHSFTAFLELLKTLPSSPAS
jgi:VRR-NUC domain